MRELQSHKRSSVTNDLGDKDASEYGLQSHKRSSVTRSVRRNPHSLLRFNRTSVLL